MTGILGALGNHLWQSTAFAACAGLATLAFRANRAAVRHAIWLAASVKFLVPFAALMAIGPLVHVRAPATSQRRIVVRTVIETVGQPFAQTASPVALARTSSAWDGIAHTLPLVLLILWIAGALAVLAVWCVRWRRVAAVVRRATAVHDGSTVDALRRIAEASGVGRSIALVATDAPLEPGVFGILRPVLLWPQRIALHLDDDQIAAVLTHEVAHVRRRDNLAAALHMLVDALFWFHPLVWWIGARLMDERERACDETVVGSGSCPEVYAETILRSCRAFLESPLPCVAGVTGSNLALRIERIMRREASHPLSAPKKLLLAALAGGAVAAPIVMGAAAPARARIDASITSAHLLLPADQAAPAFEVASVRPIRSMATKEMIDTQPGGRFTATNVTLRQLIRFAYHLQDFQVSGGPAWLADDRFDIVAKAEGGELDDPFEAEKLGPASRGQMMLRTLLAERFKLQVHTDSRQETVYALTIVRPDGRLGPQLQPTTRDCAARENGAAAPAGKATALSASPPCGMRVLPGTMLAGGVRLAQFANALAPFVGRLVQDRTGLSGDFEFALRWTPDQIPQGFDRKAGAMGLAPIDPDGPSLMTALREQLGLQLTAQKAPIEILIIDRAERPTEH